MNENIDGVDGTVFFAEFGEVVSLAVGHQHYVLVPTASCAASGTSA